MSKNQISALAVGAAVLLLAVTGCAQSNKDAATSACVKEADAAAYTTDQETRVTKVDVVVSQTRLSAGGGAAYDVVGKATLTTDVETEYAWNCFAQTVDGKTYADVGSFQKLPS